MFDDFHKFHLSFLNDFKSFEANVLFEVTFQIIQINFGTGIGNVCVDRESFKTFSKIFSIY